MLLFAAAPDVADVVAEPADGDYFLLSVKLHTFLALNVQIAVEGLIPTSEREHGHGCWDANVNPDHACFDSMLKFARCSAGIRKDGGAVAVS